MNDTRPTTSTSSHDDWYEHPDYVELTEALFAGADDSWDGDEDQETILVRYVQHLLSEVQRLGGCARPFCSWDDGEPCDHGYLPIPILP